MSCSNFLILVSSFLVILAAACQDSDEGNEAGVTNVSRNAMHEEATGARKKLQKQWLPRGRRKRRPDIDCQTPAIAPWSMLILQSQARLKLSRMTRFRAATDRHVERLESSGNGSWNHFLELLFAFCHFQVSTKYSWWKRVLRFFRAKRKRKQGAPCPPHTRGGEVAQVCRKKYFSRIDGLEGLPFNPSIRMLL